MEIEIQAQGASLAPVVAVRGEIDLSTCPLLQGALGDLLDAGERNIVLDLAGVAFMDSAALSVLMEADRRARERGGGLHLTRLQPRVRRGLDTTLLIRLFRVYESVEAARTEISALAALATLTSPSPPPRDG